MGKSHQDRSSEEKMVVISEVSHMSKLIYSCEMNNSVILTIQLSGSLRDDIVEYFVLLLLVSLDFSLGGSLCLALLFTFCLWIRK